MLEVDLQNPKVCEIVTLLVRLPSERDCSTAFVCCRYSPGKGADFVPAASVGLPLVRSAALEPLRR